ncbi:MAG: hypothetical protein QM778_33800 [Myxococcales bacterium]
MATSIAWLMNLDADVELSAPAAYRPDLEREARIVELVARMATLVRSDDVVLGAHAQADVVAAAGRRVLAFCPTPHALRRLHAIGLELSVAAPDLAALREANGRAFCARLGQTLAGASYVYDMETLEQLVKSCEPDQDLVLKRPFGFAGRERRRAIGGVLDASSRGFARRSFESGEGLQVEPWLRRTRDFALHGYLAADGTLLSGPLMEQHCDAMGRWLRSSPALEPLPPAHRARLDHELAHSGRALHAIGYFGPFGLDAFEYQGPGGALEFQPRSEINARFSMGYPRSLLERALTELMGPS